MNDANDMNDFKDFNDMNEISDEPRSNDPVRFPLSVRIAGIIWILFGTLQIVSAIVQIVQREGKAPNMCGWFIAIAFLVIGIQTVCGSAKAMLGNGIGSILFSLLLFAFAGLSALISAGVTGDDVKQRLQYDETVLLVIAAVSFGLALMLFTAGALAILGRHDYDAWRKSKMKYRRHNH